MTPPAREGRLGPALLVALLVASLATGVWVYHARTPNLALEVLSIERVLGPGGEADLPVEIEWLVRFDEPQAQVEIVGARDVTVRTFATSAGLVEDERVRCQWDGLDDEGDPVVPGNYRLRVVLPSADRDMVFPQRIKVRREPPGNTEVAGGPCSRPNGEALE